MCLWASAFSISSSLNFTKKKKWRGGLWGFFVVVVVLNVRKVSGAPNQVSLTYTLSEAYHGGQDA